MRVVTALRAATCLVVGDGIVALYLGGLVGGPGALLTGAAAAGSWWAPRLRERLGARRGVGLGVAVLAGAGLAVDLVYVAESALDGFIHLLLFLLLYRLYTHRAARDTRDAVFLAFFMLVAASSVTFGVGFLFVFVAFLVLGTALLLLQHVVAEAELVSPPTAGGGGTALGLERDLLRMSLAAAAATLVITSGLFFVIPRLGLAVAPLGARLVRMVSGFSDRVELGAFGEIEADPTVVMRVHVTSGGLPPEHLPNLRWRGIALDRFDGRTWTSARLERGMPRRGVGGQFDLEGPRGDGAIVSQEVYLEPIGTEVIFGAPRVLGARLRTDTIVVDPEGSLSVPRVMGRFQYGIQSQLEPTDPFATPGDILKSGLDGVARARYLQLPPLPGRIAALAREVAAGSRTPEEAALRLTAFLRSEYRYTLVLGRQTTLDPLEEFLFVRRSGNCEYFAAALAVMLRTLGIPARVVNGFQRGEWNPYGAYFMVRLRDAHSWVEAHFDRAGWVTLDPSPRAAAEAAAAPGPLGLYLDALRMRWYQYVINWSLQDQVMVALTVQRQATTWKLSLASLHLWESLPPAAMAALALLVVAIVILLSRRAAPARTGRSGARLPRFYRRALRTLALRGLRLAPGETAREFAERAGAACPAAGAPLVRLTAAYERTRFGAAALTAPELEEVEACLLTLGRTTRSRLAARLIVGAKHG